MSGTETALYDGILYYGITDGSVYFVNDQDEARIWAIDTDGNNIRQITQSARCVNVLYMPNGIIYSYLNEDLATGGVAMCQADGSDNTDISDLFMIY